MLSLLKNALLITVALYFLACAALYFFQNRLLYYPTPETKTAQADEFTISNDGLTLKIWKVDAGNRRVIFYFGGNAETVQRNIAPLRETVSDADLYLMNYRGYGGSEGAPSEQGVYSDALALYDAIAPNYDEIIVIGRSLGSGVATYLAANRSVSHIVLITPYDSIANVAQAKFPIFPVKLLIRDRYDSAGRAENLSAPVLMILAENDAVIPRHHSDALASAIRNAPVETVTVEDTNHLSVSSKPEFWSALRAFLSVQTTTAPLIAAPE
ncbi:MAG: alpha/beta hydrolase [Pseudomonadota bacterium]